MKNGPRHSLRLSALSTAGAATLAVAIAAGAAQPAFAQQPTAAEDRVVVTGSRIARRDLTSQTPIVTVDTDTLENTSEISLDQTLSQLPQFGEGRDQLTDAGATQATPTTSPGAATVNLRGLGSNRTLVLLDGRRTQPANASLVVDINTIPSAALDSVEIITGGAAATYGADAVAGVVNFILRDDYEGVTLDAQYGETEQGDGAQYRLSALLGSNFAGDRGNAMLGLTYSEREVVYQRDRDFFVEGWADINNSGGSSFPGFGGFQPAFGNYPTQAAVNSVFLAKGYPEGDVSRTGGIYFNQAPSTEAATVFSPNAGSVSGQPAPGYTGVLFPEHKIVYNGNLASNNTVGQLSLPLTRYSVFANTHYDVTDSVTVYGQAKFDQTETSTRSAYVPAVNQWSVTIPYDPNTDDPDSPGYVPLGPGAGHPVPAELADILNSRPDPDADWQYQKRLDYLGPEGLDTITNTYELLFGVRGDLPYKDWTYDVFYSHGRTYQVAEYVNFADLSRRQALLDAPGYGILPDANANAFTNFRLGRAASCQTGLSPFLEGAVAQDCIDIVQARLFTTTDLIQDQLEANIQGGLFEAPAGEVRFAIGTDYRKNDFDYRPSSNLSTTNITSHTLGLFDTTPTGGSVEVAEFYGELLAPIVADLPFARSITANLGYRFSDYNTGAGGVHTFKAIADWVVNDYVTFRGGFQRATRAPNVAELFQPPTFLTVGWSDHDPCSNLTRADFGNVASNPDRAQVQALCTSIAGGFAIGDSYVGNQPFYFPLGRDSQTGNPDLDPEEADTITVGAVVRSPIDADGFRNMTLTVDYYDITIDGAIQTRGTQEIYRDCFNADGTNPSYDPTYEACTKIVRSNVTGFWLTTIAEFSNLGSINTSGFDAALAWNAGLPDGLGVDGTAFANISFNYVDKFEIQDLPGGTALEYADSTSSPTGSAIYEWKLYSTVGVNVGPATVSLNWRHLPETRNSTLVTTPAATVLPTKSYDLFGLSGRWAINDTLELRAGVDNLLDKRPPLVGVDPASPTGSAVGTTDAGNYDVLGRRFYVGAKARF